MFHEKSLLNIFKNLCQSFILLIQLSDRLLLRLTHNILLYLLILMESSYTIKYETILKKRHYLNNTKVRV